MFRFDPASILFLCVSLPGMSMTAQTTAGAQEPDATQQPYTLSVKARTVVLDVVVTDRKGNLVLPATLKRDDFTIYEDKVVQSIRSFDQPSAHSMPAGSGVVVHSAADLKKIGDAPVTILLLDELNSAFQDMSYSRQMMIKYLAGAASGAERADAIDDHDE